MNGLYAPLYLIAVKTVSAEGTNRSCRQCAPHRRQCAPHRRHVDPKGKHLTVRPFAALRVTASHRRQGAPHRRHVDPKGKQLTVRPFAALRVTNPKGKHLSEALRCAQGDESEGETTHSEALRFDV